MVFVCALIVFRMSITEAAIITAGTMVSSAATNLRLIRRQDKKQRGMRLCVCENRIILSELKKQERDLLLDEIVRIRVLENPKGNIQCITLWANNKSKKKQLRIYGFNKMGEILELIKEKVPNTALVQTKRFLLDAQRPLFVVVVLTITLILILGCICVARAIGLVD